ncbi:hypothetical protein HOP50_01g03410 [Chloropicon primus]|uniref:Uncharacterized protein n=1 Tax=Chloropicon primus TaxID=1764295 RepID=A0A5B8MCP5_9CHLO|nr:hypothetical protein A3770_01p03520 [Chloropicon primus]UPQ97050.1 hypothetical protein HOP50_01g03410 [Chloropicon primus]|eukprot:QDZ17834.1 hypothetical protein A3770_01p03520 [Chloropicon primus]
MSDAKTVEVLSRYKADAKRAGPQEYNGTHLEESPKYPSFYSGRGLDPRESANTVGFMHSQGISQKDSSTESGGRHHRTSGIAMKQVENEVKNQFMKLPGFTGGYLGATTKQNFTASRFRMNQARRGSNQSTSSTRSNTPVAR